MKKIALAIIGIVIVNCLIAQKLQCTIDGISQEVKASIPLILSSTDFQKLSLTFTGYAGGNYTYIIKYDGSPVGQITGPIVNGNILALKPLTSINWLVIRAINSATQNETLYTIVEDNRAPGVAAPTPAGAAEPKVYAISNDAAQNTSNQLTNNNSDQIDATKFASFQFNIIPSATAGAYTYIVKIDGSAQASTPIIPGQKFPLTAVPKGWKQVDLMISTTDKTPVVYNYSVKSGAGLPAAPATTPTANDISGVFGGALGYNFLPKSNGNAIMPEIQAGFNYVYEPPSDAKILKKFRDDFNFLLYSSASGLVDSTNALPALMLPGTFNAALTNTFTQKLNDSTGNRQSAIFFTLGAGLKEISGLQKAKGAILQYNGRIGIGLKVREFFSLTGEAVFGAHNMTTDQEANYRALFNKPTGSTYINYYVFRLQSKLAFGPNKQVDLGYVYFDWRFVDRANYSSFSPQSFLTIGFIKTLDFSLKTVVNNSNAISTGSDNNPPPRKREYYLSNGTF